MVRCKKALAEIKDRELAEKEASQNSRLAGLADPEADRIASLAPEDVFAEKAILDAYDRGADTFKALKRLRIGEVTLRRVVGYLQATGKISLREE